MWPEQVGIVKLDALLTATHALKGLAGADWDRASRARPGNTLAILLIGVGSVVDQHRAIRAVSRRIRIKDESLIQTAGQLEAKRVRVGDVIEEGRDRVTAWTDS